VEKAIAANDQLIHNTEIFVVDNHSTDESIEYLQNKFQRIKFIDNEENTGFAKANNLALSKAIGKYILFLNPDTIIAEDSIATCISFMESKLRAGAVGVRMIDGHGDFLKESKRGFPSPWAAFCKLSGLTAAFSHSRLFASYYLGHLSEHENNPVAILSGAFMVIRKEVLDKTGGFDEQFFMYAEDIDLSYRIQQAGFVNYYIADTTIIHFKGESTKKNLQYVKLFYKAMDQFMRKHINGPSLFLFFMKMAVWFRSRLASVAYLFHRKDKNKKYHQSFLEGDKKNIDQLKPLLPTIGRTIAPNAEESDEIILCEGDRFSFKEIIEQIQQKKQLVSIKIHAANSHSIVGSDYKDRNGESIAID